jgi:hypothetical protein
MRKSTRSILQELSDIGLNRNTDLVIESRGSNIIQSAINLLDMIRENYDVETASELERRFINSIKGSDPAKFKRGIKRIQESKDLPLKIAISLAFFQSQLNNITKAF